MKVSECINRLTEVWLLWLQTNSSAQDLNLPKEIRRKFVLEAECLIEERHNLVAYINENFDLEINNGN